MQLDNFLQIMDKLLGPDGCPWDKEQTHESLRQYMLEESYEAIEAINNKDMHALKEELGDVLLQVVFHAKLAEIAGSFTMDDVIATLAQKITSRHTHIFGTDEAKSAEDVAKVWEANKQKEQKLTPAQAMQAVPKALPALVRAAKVLKRSHNVCSPSLDAHLADIHTSLDCLRNTDAPHHELYGKILLQMVALSAFLEINAEFSLTNALEGFINTSSVENPAISGL